MNLFKKIIFVFVVLCIGNLYVNAAEDREVTTNCSSTSNCSLSIEQYSLKIKKITVNDTDSDTVLTLNDWQINPKAIYVDQEGQPIYVTNLNLEIPNLSKLIKDETSSTAFEGYINIEYEVDIKNPYDYTYRFDEPKQLLAMLLSPDTLLMQSLPITGSFNYAYLKIDDSGNVDILGSIETEQDGWNITTSFLLAIINANEKIGVNTNTNDLKASGFGVTSMDLNEYEKSLTSEGTFDFENFEDFEQASEDDIKIVDSADEVIAEQSAEKSPKTSVISNIVLIGLAIMSMGLFIYINKKVLKRKI